MNKVLMALLGTLTITAMIVFARFFVEFVCSLKKRGLTILVVVGFFLVYLYFYYLILK